MLVHRETRELSFPAPSTLAECFAVLEEDPTRLADFFNTAYCYQLILQQLMDVFQNPPPEGIDTQGIYIDAMHLLEILEYMIYIPLAAADIFITQYKNDPRKGCGAYIKEDTMNFVKVQTSLQTHLESAWLDLENLDPTLPKRKTSQTPVPAYGVLELLLRIVTSREQNITTIDQLQDEFENLLSFPPAEEGNTAIMLQGLPTIVFVCVGTGPLSSMVITASAEGISKAGFSGAPPEYRDERVVSSPFTIFGDKSRRVRYGTDADTDTAGAAKYIPKELTNEIIKTSKAALTDLKNRYNAKERIYEYNIDHNRVNTQTLRELKIESRKEYRDKFAGGFPHSTEIGVPMRPPGFRTTSRCLRCIGTFRYQGDAGREVVENEFLESQEPERFHNMSCAETFAHAYCLDAGHVHGEDLDLYR